MPSTDVPGSPLKRRVVDFINKIKNSNEDDMQEIADRIAGNDKSPVKRNTDKLMAGLYAFKERLDQYLELFTDDAAPEFADIITNPRDFKVVYRDDETKAYAATQFSRQADLLWRYVLPGQTTESLKDEYVKARENYHARWIKTPSVVVSWSSKDSVGTQGGHNLGAKVTPFKLSSEVPKGEIRIIEEGGIKKALINEADISNIDPAILRRIAVAGDDIPDHLTLANINYKPRAIADVLPSQSNRSGRGLSENHIHNIKAIPEGFIINGEKVNDCEQLRTRLADLIAEDKSVENLQLHFEKVSESEAKALIKSSEIKLAGNELTSMRMLKSGEVFNINRTRFDFGKAKVISNLVDNEIVIEIPHIVNVKSRARLSITGFLMEKKNQIVTKIKSLLGIARGNDINFYNSVVNELKEYNVRPQDIIIEIDDCIICIRIKERTDGDC